jgi:hypothetical protein
VANSAHVSPWNGDSGDRKDTPKGEPFVLDFYLSFMLGGEVAQKMWYMHTRDYFLVLVLSN